MSLGLPVYNGEEFLAEALDSLLAQTFEDFELVVSDNGSTDLTREICLDYGSRDSRLKYLRSDQNRGVSYNFRRVFEASSGPLFKWVVHDDTCEPTYLERCHETLSGAPSDVVLVYPRTNLIDEGGAFTSRYEDRVDLREPKPQARLKHLLRNLRFCHCGLGLIRRSALEKTRLIDGFESSDIVMLQELAMMGQFWEIPEFLYNRRIHTSSSFGNYRSKEDYARRMDPENKSKVVMPRTRLFRESLRSIRRADISPVQRLHCARVLLAVWGPKYWRVIIGEWRRALSFTMGFREEMWERETKEA